jgi:hypothetical protein
MACFYCNKQYVSTPDNGSCVECNNAVCTSPPQRPDKVYHGVTCTCTCRKLVCRYDAPTHAATHGHQTSDCFPASVAGFASDALASSVRAAQERRTAERLDRDAVDRFNEFLSFAVPGHPALLAALERQPGRGVRETVEIRTTGNARWPAFGAEFFSEGALDRVAGLAARAIVLATHALAPAELEAAGLDRLIDVARALNVPNVELRMPRSPHPELAEQWYSAWQGTPAFVEFADRLAGTHAERGTKAPASILRALTYTVVPASADAIADWVVEEPVLTPAMG